MTGLNGKCRANMGNGLSGGRGFTGQANWDTEGLLKISKQGGGGFVVPARGVLLSRTFNRSLLSTQCAQDEGEV